MSKVITYVIEENGEEISKQRSWDGSSFDIIAEGIEDEFKDDESFRFEPDIWTQKINMENLYPE